MGSRIRDGRVRRQQGVLTGSLIWRELAELVRRSVRPEPTGLVISKGLRELRVGVHDERSLPGHWFADRLGMPKQDYRIGLGCHLDALAVGPEPYKLSRRHFVAVDQNAALKDTALSVFTPDIASKILKERARPLAGRRAVTIVWGI